MSIFYVRLYCFTDCPEQQEVRELQSSFSAEKTTTVWKTLPTLDCLQDRWETMANNSKFILVAEAIEAGLAKIRKYYGALDDVDFYFICLGV